MKQKSEAAGKVGGEPLYSIDDYRPEESIGVLIGMVRSRFMAVLDDDLVDLGLTSAQLPVLHWINVTPNATAATLCRCLGTNTGSMTRMLGRLEGKGFIRRVRSQADRRVVHVELTAAGKALWPQINACMVKMLNRFLTGFQRKDLELLKSLLRRILENT